MKYPFSQILMKTCLKRKLKKPEVTLLVTLVITQNRGLEELRQPQPLSLPVWFSLPHAWVFLAHSALPTIADYVPNSGAPSRM